MSRCCCSQHKIHNWAFFQERIENSLKPSWITRNVTPVLSTLTTPMLAFLLPIVMHDESTLCINPRNFKAWLFKDACPSSAWKSSLTFFHVTGITLTVLLLSRLYSSCKKNSSHVEQDKRKIVAEIWQNFLIETDLSKIQDLNVILKRYNRMYPRISSEFICKIYKNSRLSKDEIIDLLTSTSIVSRIPHKAPIPEEARIAYDSLAECYGNAIELYMAPPRKQLNTLSTSSKKEAKTE